MWRLVFVVVLWSPIKSQPITDDSDNNRQPRQLDFECCPCPGARASVQDMGQMLHPLDQMGQPVWPMGQSFEDHITHQSGVDECPCRLRDADSEGSSSIFFPRAMRPVRPVMRTENAKEDPKPLLHPEVGFASSVLETLRDATDEEYKEALARDAARNAARMSELGDAEPEAAKNIIIVVNPHDDATQEASTAHETRCAHPLGVNRLGEVRANSNKSPIFKLAPSFRNVDMDSGANNVQESVVGINKGLEGLRLKTTPSVLKLLSSKRSGSEGNIQSLLKLRNKSKDLPKEAFETPKVLDKSLRSKVPRLRFPSLLSKNGLANPLNLGINKLNITKLKDIHARKPKLGNSNSFDNNPSPSNVEEQVSVLPTTGNIPRFALKSLLPTKDATKTPLSLKNLLNLKDVELIPPKSLTPKISLPDFKLLPPLRINKLDTNFVKQRKIKGSDMKNTCNKNDGRVNEANAQLISRNEKIRTEILDALPSPSSATKLIAAPINGIETTTSADAVAISKDKHVQTEILDALPSASENNHIIAVDENHTQTTTSVNDVTSDLDEDSVSQNIEEAVTASPSNLSKGNVKANDDSGIEFIFDEDENGEFEEVEVVEQTDEPVSEFEITDESVDGEDNDVNVEIIESPDFNSESIDFNIGEIERIINEESEIENVQEESDQFGSVESDDETTNVDLFKAYNPAGQNDDQDAVVEPSNRVMLIEPTEVVEVSRENFSVENNFRGDTPSQEESLQSKQLRNDDILSSIKERITLKLKTLKNPDTKVLTISRLAKQEIPENVGDTNERSSINSAESVDIEPLKEDTEQFLIEEKSAENIENINNNPRHEVHQSDNTECKCFLGNSQLESDNHESNKNGLINNNSESNEKPDMTSSATSNSDIVKTANDLSNLEEFLSNDDENLSTRQGFADNVSNNENIGKNVCPTNFKSSEVLDDTDSSIQVNEMASEASESVFNRAPQSSVLRQEIVQPSSLFDGNLFSPIPALDLSNLNPQLPTLEDITSGISSILGGNQRSAEDEELTSIEFNSAEDCSNTEPMSPGASTTNSKSALPSFRPLEDINLDIFQINPLSQGSPFTPKVPALNLNSFKTKLSLPERLNLTPMKLQSTLGGKNGLFGATLSLGPDKIGSFRNAKPVTKLSSISNRQGLDILGNPLANMPSLDELRSTMHSNAQNLFNSPVTKQISGPIEDTLRASQTLGNSLKTHTENTVKNIQQTLASTMNEARVSGRNNVRTKFAKPENLLEMVSSAHEDMNDKLHAIHTDLKDRLSTIHDHITEKSNIPTLQSPLLKGLGSLGDHPLRSSFFRSGVKKSPTFSQISHQTLPKNMKLTKKPNARVTRPITKTKVTIAPPQGRNTKEQSQFKPYKISKAASSLSPKAVEVPKLRTTFSKPPFSRPLQRDGSVKLKDTRPAFTTEQARNQKSKPQFKPFGDFKVSISTTPPSTSFRSRSQPTNRHLNSKLSGLRTEQSRQRGTSSRPPKTGDSRGFASEPKPVQIPPPANLITTKITEDFESVERQPIFEDWPSSTGLGSRPNSFSTPLSSRTSLPSSPLTSSQKLPALKGIPSTLSLPKTSESPLLTKMRDAIKIRFPNHPRELVNNSKHKGVGKHSDDMIKSASENRDVVLRTEPMKENVSYKCKMVCVREP